MTLKIKGIRKVVQELQHIPNGYHLELWSEKKGETVELWTSCLLTVNSWTVYESNPESVKLDYYLNAVWHDVYTVGETISLTDAIKRAVKYAYREGVA